MREGFQLLFIFIHSELCITPPLKIQYGPVTVLLILTLKEDVSRGWTKKGFGSNELEPSLHYSAFCVAYQSFLVCVAYSLFLCLLLIIEHVREGWSFFFWDRDHSVDMMTWNFNQIADSQGHGFLFDCSPMILVLFPHKECSELGLIQRTWRWLLAWLWPLLVTHTRAVPHMLMPRRLSISFYDRRNMVYFLFMRLPTVDTCEVTSPSVIGWVSTDW